MLRKLLPHAAIVLSGMYFVFFFIDKVNAPMEFINNDITKALLFILCVLVLIESITLIRISRRGVRPQVMDNRKRAATGGYSSRPAGSYRGGYDRRFAANGRSAARRYGSDAQSQRGQTRRYRY